MRGGGALKSTADNSMASIIMIGQISIEDCVTRQPEAKARSAKLGLQALVYVCPGTAYVV